MSGLSSTTRTRGRDADCSAGGLRLRRDSAPTQAFASCTNAARLPPSPAIRCRLRRRRARRGAPSNGNSTVKVLPAPGLLVTTTSPPSARTNSRTSASPIPVPSIDRASDSGTR